MKHSMVSTARRGRVSARHPAARVVGTVLVLMSSARSPRIGCEPLRPDPNPAARGPGATKRWPERGRSPRRLWRRARATLSVTFASSWATRRPVATSSMTRPRARSSSRPSRPWSSQTRTARSSSAARSRPSRRPRQLRRRVPTGAGVGWHQHDDHLFSGVLRPYRPGYAAHLVKDWLPALDGLLDRLCSAASVADVGCGLGASTIISAQAFQRSTFAGFDTTTPRSSRYATRPRRRACSGGRGSTPPPPRSPPAPATTSC